jgi:hypothetical protein
MTCEEKANLFATWQLTDPLVARNSVAQSPNRPASIR